MTVLAYLPQIDITSNGEINNALTGNKINPMITKIGKRPTINIPVDRQRSVQVWVSHLVALAFCPLIPEVSPVNQVVEHIDGNFDNLDYSNLRWVIGSYRYSSMDKTAKYLDLLREQQEAVDLVTGQGLLNDIQNANKGAMSFDTLPAGVRARMMESMKGDFPISNDIIEAEFTQID